MKRFEEGKTYMCRSLCDYDCIWTFTVVRRTEKTAWLRDEDGIDTRRGIVTYLDEEVIFPLGKYSMAPVLKPDKLT